MANHKSAIKRHKQSQKRRERNVAIKSSLKTAVKNIRQAVAEKDTKKSQELLPEMVQMIDKASTKGVLHSNTASRKVSRLTKLVNTLEAQKG